MVSTAWDLVCWAVLVTAAEFDVDDARAATELFARTGRPAEMGKVVRMYADSKYHNFRAVRSGSMHEAKKRAVRELSIVRRPEGLWV